MFIKIDSESGVPIYLQIIKQIKYSIAAGALKPRDKLPPVRKLAAQLRINPNTVARAYRELQNEKVINSKWGDASYVSEEGLNISKRERIRILSELLDNTLAQAFYLGLSPEKIKEILEDRLKKLNK